MCDFPLINNNQSHAIGDKRQNNTYIDISDNSVFEIKLFLYEIRDFYKLKTVNSDIEKEISENRMTIVLNHREKICYLENEKYDNSINILSYYG